MTRFCVRSPTAVRFDLGQCKLKFAQRLFKKGDLLIYRATQHEWYVVTALSDNGDERIPVHFLNVDPKNHGGSDKKAKVCDVPLRYRIFHYVWISLSDNDRPEKYSSKSVPEGYAPFTASASRRMLCLHNKLFRTNKYRLTDDSITAIMAYASSRKTFNPTFAST